MNIRFAVAALCGLVSVNLYAQNAGSTLQPPSSFDKIADPAERSAALFIEAGKVINHPRCLNCHPNARVPTQGDAMRQHVPYINATESGHGKPGLTCTGCHQAKNVSAPGAAFRTVPGHDHWSLAPSSMAWQQKSMKEICEQLKDPKRNGGKTLEQIAEHMHKDGLVGWAWHPGEGRTPAPGTQDQFGLLIKGWIALGAACPK